jgi:hypothetical protein
MGRGATACGERLRAAIVHRRLTDDLGSESESSAAMPASLIGQRA